MDTELVFKFVTAQLKQVTTQVFHQYNRSTKVIYPYVTYDLDYSLVDEIREVYELQVDVFNHGTSIVPLLKVETELKTALERQKFILDEAIIYTRVINSRNIPTGDDTIQRRNIRIEIKIDWRID